MRPRHVLLLALLGTALGAGLLYLFRLRYVSGDVYRPYSSLRADPLGTKALHDALAELEGLTVERNLRPTDLLSGDRETALLVLGASISYPFPIVHPLAEDLDRVAREGARVVVALAPVSTESEPEDEEEEGEEEREEEEEGEQEGEGNGKEEGRTSEGRAAPADDETTSAQRRWDLRLAFEALDKTDRDEPVAAVVERVAGDPLPGSLGWRSSIVLAATDPAWRVLYERDGRPVVVERRLGRGSLVLATDAYFASNEALHEEPEPALLAWLVGAHSRVVFEETHLGTADSPGVVELARRYRLHGLALGLAGLVGLLVWRQASGFIPTWEQAGREARDAVLGRGSAEGLTDLLRRGIAPKTLVATCIREWAGTSHDRRETARQLLALARQPGTPVEAYRRVARALEKKGET